jgi:hypothetical protein
LGLIAALDGITAVNKLTGISDAAIPEASVESEGLSLDETLDSCRKSLVEVVSRFINKAKLIYAALAASVR